MPVKLNSSTIVLKGDAARTRIQRDAIAAITPGELLEELPAGFQAHGTANGAILPPIFAVENEIAGDGIGVDYPINSAVQAWVPRRGDEVLARLADSQVAVIGSLLVSNGDGTLKVLAAVLATTLEGEVVGRSTEAVTTSGAVLNIRIRAV